MDTLIGTYAGFFSRQRWQGYRGGMSETKEPQESGPLESGKQPLSPALKSWLDNVLVPAMVKQWLAENGKEHGNGSSPTTVQARGKREDRS
jgi:hypothetical protein